MALFKVIYRPGPYIMDTGVSKYHDDEALETVINYCQDEAKTDGQYIGGFGVNIAQAAHEMDLLAWAYGANKGLRLRHWILAFSRDEVRQFGSNVYPTLEHIARQAAAYYGNQYQIIYAVHMDHDHPHIHFVMNTVNYVTGRKYPGDKADYYAYQKRLQEILLPYGLYVMAVSDDGKRADF